MVPGHGPRPGYRRRIERVLCRCVGSSLLRWAHDYKMFSYDFTYLSPFHTAKGWTYPCMAGYPSLTSKYKPLFNCITFCLQNTLVPIGFFPESTPPCCPPGGTLPYPAPGMPFAISFFGTAWSERVLIGCAFALERELHKRGFDRTRGFHDYARPKIRLKDVITCS